MGQFKYILVPEYMALYMVKQGNGIPANWLIVPDNAVEKVLYGMKLLSEVKALTVSEFYKELNK